MAVLMTPPYMSFTDSNGNPLSGGKVFTYTAGTLTPKATYTDSTEGVSNANPVILDSAGRAAIWLNGSYKFIVKDSADATISTTDNVTAFSTSATNIDQILPSQTGNAGKFLTTNGTNSSWGAAASSFVLIKTQPASASTTVDFINGTGGVVLDSTYKAYVLVITGLLAGTSTADLWMRTSTNAGSSFDSGATDYSYGETQIRAGTATGISAGGDTKIILTSKVASSATPVHGFVYIFNPSATTVQAEVGFQLFGTNSDGNSQATFGQGARASNADIDAFRILMSTGTFSATLSLYGIKDT